MGATTDFRTYKTDDTAVVKKKFASACEDARYEDGHGGYTGTIAEMSGVKTWKDLRLDSRDEAEDYIDENHDKWDDAMAVSYVVDGAVHWIVGGWCSE